MSAAICVLGAIVGVSISVYALSIFGWAIVSMVRGR
jgi:hypothetical protein